MSNGKKQGQQLQEELFRWYISLIRENTCAAAQPAVQGLNALKHHIEVLVKDGWTLSMSEHSSTADLAGVDFVWENPRRGWFPLDAKAVGQTSCLLINQVHVGNNTEAGEYKQLRFEDKLAFLEKLVALARTGRPIRYDDCAPPGVKTKCQSTLLEELKQFQQRLQKASSRLQDDRFRDWATALNKAVGFLLKQKRGGPSAEAIEAARKAINAAVEAFFAKYFGKNEMFATQCMRLQPNLRRSDRLVYVYIDDMFKAEVGRDHELVVLSGVAPMVRKQFEERYAELLKRHSAAEWLIQRKRTFETKGLECVVHNILDAFQRQSGARSAA